MFFISLLQTIQINFSNSIPRDKVWIYACDMETNKHPRVPCLKKPWQVQGIFFFSITNTLFTASSFLVVDLRIRHSAEGLLHLCVILLEGNTEKHVQIASFTITMITHVHKLPS
jgi:hypothetical protein